MQMQRMKVGNKHKGHRSMVKKSYYERFRQRYSGKLIRRRAKRQKGILAAKGKVKHLHPSDIRRMEGRKHLQ